MGGVRTADHGIEAHDALQVCIPHKCLYCPGSRLPGDFLAQSHRPLDSLGGTRGVYWLVPVDGPGRGRGLGRYQEHEFRGRAHAGVRRSFVGRATERHTYQPIAFLQIATAALLMLPSVPLLEHAHVLWSWRVIAAILVTALLSTAAAFTIQSWAQQFMPATNVALIFSLEPVFAWLIAYLVLRESLQLRAAAGAVLIVAGLLLSELLGNVKNRETVGVKIAV